MSYRTVRIAGLLAALVIALCGGVLAALTTSREPSRSASSREATEAWFPYRSEAFTELVAESYRDGGGLGQPADFYRWVDRAYARLHLAPAGQQQLTLEQALDQDRRKLAAQRDPAARAAMETAQGAWLHRVVKRMLPNFSLERGFEFRYAEAKAERQCFLQSVLIAGLLQRIGIHAGVVMVFKNERGQESNNGHAAVLVKLDDGRDALVDASDPKPFMRHQGLFARAPHYRFVAPVYASDAPRIAGYRQLRDGRGLSPDSVRPLDLAFVRSQFRYYRGERAAGGILAAHPTRAGLRASARYFEASQRACASNPLAAYMLGRVYLLEGRATQAKQVLARARGLYAQFGWVPQGPKQYLALAQQRARGG